MTQEFREVARNYHEQGYVIIPFRYGKDDKGEVTKKPDITEWKMWQTRPQTEKEFSSLKLETADGFGLLCGVPNKDGLVLGAIDYDVKRNVMEEAKVIGKQILDMLPITKRDETQSKGLHHYYLSHSAVSTDKSYKNSTALEFLGLGALIYIEPSKGYRRINDNSFTVLQDLQTKFYQVLQEQGIATKTKGSGPEDKQAIDENAPVTVDVSAIFENSPTLKDCYQGKWEKYDSFKTRSDVEEFILVEFMRYGLKPSRIRELMKESKVGKWNEPNKEAYHDISIKKAARFIQKKALKPHLQPEPCIDNTQGKTEKTEQKPEKQVFEADVEQQIEEEVNRIKEAENQLKALGPHLDRLTVGEENTKKAIAILNLSGKSPDPKTKQILLLKAEPGSGKSQLMQKLTQGYKVKDVGRFSAHALDYANLEGFEILRLKELGSMDEEKQGVSTVKFLSSDDQGYTVEITAKNEETGRFTTEQYKIPPITTISSTTRLVLDAQFERRAWLFGMDETPEQTARISVWKAETEAQNSEKILGLRKITDYEFSSEVYKRFIERFQFKTVIIPFPSSLLNLLGHEVLRIRGDMDKLLNFVKLYGQLNLKRLRLIRGDVYAISPEVAVEAVNIIIEPLTGMLGRIDKRTRQVFDALKSIVDLKEVQQPSDSKEKPLIDEVEIRYDRKNATIDKRIREKIAVKLGKSETTIRRFFTDLENSGYVSSDGKKPKTFTLLYGVLDIETKLSGLLAKTKSADTLILEMEKETQKYTQRLSVNLSPLEGEIICENQILKEKQSNIFPPSTEKKLTDPSLSPFQTALSKTPTEDRLIHKSPIVQGDTSNLSIPCPFCKAQGKQMYFANDLDLGIHVSSCHESGSDYVR